MNSSPGTYAGPSRGRSNVAAASSMLTSYQPFTDVPQREETQPQGIPLRETNTHEAETTQTSPQPPSTKECYHLHTSNEKLARDVCRIAYQLFTDINGEDKPNKRPIQGDRC